MKIKYLDIQNFRKLKCCRLDISDEQTILVGANNSGKTSAMDALTLFLNKKGDIHTTDITISNWIELNKIGAEWLRASEDTLIDFSLKKWIDYLPSIDIWIEVPEDEIYYVSHLIPSLDWEGGLIGVRLIYAPKDIEFIYKDFSTRVHNNSELTNKSDNLKLWPKDLKDYLDKVFNSLFTIKSYVLDPMKFTNCDANNLNPQVIDNFDNDLGINPLNGIIKISAINAQRGFSDANDNENKIKSFGKLSSQLREYYSKHLNPEDNPTESDIKVLEAISEAQNSFDSQLTDRFKPSINELQQLGYPGVQNPKIKLSSKVNPISSLDHSAAVLFDISQTDKDDELFSLPENYNGLGYQNLVSMVFRLMRFRDDWIKKNNRDNKLEDLHIEPIHLVLIEEPEAHLHVQVQQVFVRKAHEILTDDHFLRENEKFSTQLIISTHSSHIANEVDFSNLRYFRRVCNIDKDIPTSQVVNLSSTFGSSLDSVKFAKRYLKVTHCDLFFSDAIILVEGAAEKILLPRFIEKDFKSLYSSYITILEIGGSHAHRLRPMIEALGIPTLVITDLDACDSSQKNKSVRPMKAKGYKTNNDTLKKWIPKLENLDDLLKLDKNKKTNEEQNVYITYQYPFEIKIDDNPSEIIPYTFEDALFYSNLEKFKISSGTGMIKKFNEILNKNINAENLSEAAYEIVKNTNNSKAKLALDILFSDDFCDINTPKYIEDGLVWLTGKLSKSTKENQNE